MTQNKTSLSPDTPSPTCSTSNRAEPHSAAGYSFVQRVLLVSFAVVAVWAAYKARQVMLLAIAGLVIGVALGGSARKLSQCISWAKPQRRYPLALWLISIASLTLVLLGGYYVGPRVAEDIRQLNTEIPKAIEVVKNSAPIQAYLDNGARGLSNEQVKRLTGALTTAAGTLFTGMIYTTTSFALVVFVGIFAAAQPKLYVGVISSIFPYRLRKDCSDTIHACLMALWNWLMGQGLAMLIIGALSTTGLWLIDVRYALTLGILAGLFQFVPYVGPIISAVPALIVAITMSPQTVLWVALLYLGIQFIEGNFITPMVMQEKANLPPLVTLLSTVLFAAIFGLLGAIVATPLAVILMTLKQEIYEKRVLNPQLKNQR